MSAALWSGDPALIVYAVRYALGRSTHAPELCRQAIAANIGDLPGVARRTLVTDISAWLAGPGAAAAEEIRQPWVDALALVDVMPRPLVGAR